MVTLLLCNISKAFPLIFINFLLVLISHTAASELNLASQYCINSTGNYTDNSEYENNLNTLFKDLVANATKTKYFNTSSGESPDKVYGVFFCRYDISASLCNECVQSAAKKIVEKCPKRLTSLIFYKECFLRYNNSYFDNKPAGYDAWMSWRSKGNTSHSAIIEEVLPSTMDNIIMNASYQVANRGFATTEAKISRGHHELYCLAQCTPDILGLECEKCLHFAYGDMLADCCRSQALAILRPSCMLIYDTTPFYPLLSPPLPSSPLPPESNGAVNKSNGAVYYIIRAGIPVAGLIVLLLCAIIAFYVHKKRKKNQRLENDNATLESLHFDLESMKVATNNFSEDNWLGRGGFGIVYKGKLPDGKEVAVKRLVAKDIGRGGDEQFKNEILILAKLQHRNLVTLLGFCLEEEEMLLIYEFLPNNSLDKFIFDPSKRHAVIQWEIRFKIIVGTVRGLIYLHEQSRLRIIHRDLKAGNVLLDEEFNPKISDFGMARLFNIDQTQSVASKIVGTFGYMAPEYVLQGQVSMKSDVYSFGVLILEIISGQKISSFRSGENLETLLEFVWRNWIEGTAWNVVDPTLSNSHSTEILRCVHVGLLCVQQNPKDRPTMPLVDLMLRSDPISLPVPLKPAYFESGGMLDNAPPQGSNSNQSSTNVIGNSTNEVTITELHPR